MLQVTVPDGVVEGGQFQTDTPSGPMLVTVPPGVKPGGLIQINAGAPTPMVMAPTPMAIERAMATDAHSVLSQPEQEFLQAALREADGGTWVGSSCGCWPLCHPESRMTLNNRQAVGGARCIMCATMDCGPIPCGGGEMRVEIEPLGTGYYYRNSGVEGRGVLAAGTNMLDSGVITCNIAGRIGMPNAPALWKRHHGTVQIDTRNKQVHFVMIATDESWRSNHYQTMTRL